jgi:pimeloyl-ACP methyl ester carboxylesterase
VSLHVESHGTGTPVAVFAGGLGASIAETRVFGSGVPGTRVFYDVRGHGRSDTPADGDWSYDAIARDLRAVADATGATRALGVSMGAAALLRVLCETPDRFERHVLVLPAILDTPRADVEPGLVPGAPRGLVEALATTAPVPDRRLLSRVTSPGMVVAHEGDPTHPAAIGFAIASLMPGTGYEVFPPPGIWAHRAEVRELLSLCLG